MPETDLIRPLQGLMVVGDSQIHEQAHAQPAHPAHHSLLIFIILAE